MPRSHLIGGALSEVARVCLDAAVVAIGRGDTAVAWIAVGRAGAAADRLGDPVLHGAAELIRARVARRERAAGQSLAIALRYLAAAPRLPEAAAIRGLMHLHASSAATAELAARGTAADRHLRRAEELARVPAKGDLMARLGLELSEAAVWQVRLHLALARTDLEGATVAIHRIDPDRLTALADQAEHLIDLARMQLLLDRHSRALRLVERAFDLAREHTAAAPTTEALLADMLALRLTDRVGRRVRSIYRRVRAITADPRI